MDKNRFFVKKLNMELRDAYNRLDKQIVLYDMSFRELVDLCKNDASPDLIENAALVFAANQKMCAYLERCCAIAELNCK